MKQYILNGMKVIMIEKDEELIDEILNKILRSSPGIRYVLIMDRTGITISSVEKFNTDKSMNIERLGAIAGAVYQAVEEQGECLNYGEIDSQVTEYNKGFIFSTSAGEGILCVATDKNTNMGLIRNVMKKYRTVLSTILIRYLHHDGNKISQELKTLLDQNQPDLF